MSDNAAPEVDSSASVPADAAQAPTSDNGAAEASDTVTRAEYEKLQAENKKYREKWQPIDRALGDFDDQDRQFMVEWLQSFHKDPGQFVSTAQTIISRLSPAQQTEVAEATAEAEEAKGGALTAEEVQKIIADTLDARDKSAAEQAAQQKAQDEVYAELDEHGYKRGSLEAQQVLWFALNETGGDIAKAVEKQKAAEQAVIDRYVEQKSKGPTLPPTGTSASPARSEPKSIDEARKAAAAWMQSA